MTLRRRHRRAALGQARHGRWRSRRPRADGSTATTSTAAATRRFIAVLLISSAGGRRVRERSPGVTPARRSPARGRGANLDRRLVELAAVEAVDDRRAVAAGRPIRRARAGRRARVRRRCAPRRSCRDGSARRRRRESGRGRSSRPGASPDEKSTRASTEMSSMRGLEVLARDGLDATVAAWPTFSRPRSDSSSRASRWIDDRSGSSRMLAPAQARSPFAELLLAAAEQAAGSRVRQDVDHAVGRRAAARASSMPCSARCTSNCAFSRLRRLPDSPPPRPRASDLIFCLDLFQPLLGVGKRQLGLFVLDARDRVAACRGRAWRDRRRSCAFISAVAFCSSVMRDWARACSISASACLSSDCFS